jgi:hypothetical protein
MSISIRAGDRCFIVGTTGSGKTYLAEKLLSVRADVVVVDPKHGFEWETHTYGKGVTTEDFREVVRHEGPAPLIYRPSLSECALGIPWFWVWVWNRTNTIAYVDEVTAITTPTKIPYEFARCIQMGRSKQIGVWCGTQRPARVPIVILSEAEHDFIFRLRNPADSKRMAEYSDPAILADPARGHDFWYYGDRDQVLLKTDAKHIRIRRD